MANRAQRFDSRQSMKNKQFEIFHYKDKEPSNVGIHHHDFYEIYFFLHGDVCFTVEGQSYTLTRGDLLLMSPMELHQAQIQKGLDYERIVLWIDCDYLRRLGGKHVNLAKCFDCNLKTHKNYIQMSKLEQATIAGLLDKLHTEFYGDRFGNEVYAKALLTECMVEINRLSSSATDVPQSEEKDVILEVLSFIGEHFAEPITLESLSSAFFVSKYYLSHEFRKRVGTSVYRYIIFRRLMQAKELLAEGMAPGDVYGACGFGDYANFYRAFKAECGMSPNQYAKNKK